jgi:polyisoprenoid-binding protein YceI
MRTLLSSLVLSFALLLGLSSMAEAQARTFRVRNNGGSRVQFISDAPLETITGTSSDVNGEVELDPSNLRSLIGSRVQVRVASLRTGIDLRDEHLRSDNWLGADANPNATFEITGIEGASSVQPNHQETVRIRGRFSIHGRTREITANARIRYLPNTPELQAARIAGDVLRVQASFRINLTDFGVSVPSIVRLKVSNTIRVNVSLRAVTDRPAAG